MIIGKKIEPQLISVIIPTLNEEANIVKTILRVKKLFNEIKTKYEIIIVDEKSTDNTIKNIHKQKNKNLKIIISKKKLGLGYALYQGVNVSRGEYILFLDADNSVKNIYLKRIIKKVSNKEVVIGSRYLKLSEIKGVSKIKILLSENLNKMISLIFTLKVKDSSHSLRIFHKNFKYKITNFNHPIFFWEHTINAISKGFKVSEVPISFNERLSGKTKNSFRRLFKNIILSIKNIYKLKKNQIDEKL